MYHVPVLLEESVSGLNIDPDGVYLDLTFGGGGHSREILKRLKDGCLIGFDQDADALANVPDDDRCICAISCGIAGTTRQTGFWPIWACRRMNLTRQAVGFLSDLMRSWICG